MIQRSTLYIGQDSGLTHIAGCMGCTVISIHIGYPVSYSGAISNSITFIHNGGWTKPEPISVDQVFEAVMDKLGKPRRKR
ncbi:MAG: glycosyltransferase family 9 protein [Nitrospinota bacterium]|nr:glycosyltransferase family 9 protein [Nitrospinota bacterium]